LKSLPEEGGLFDSSVGKGLIKGQPYSNVADEVMVIYEVGSQELTYDVNYYLINTSDDSSSERGLRGGLMRTPFRARSIILFLTVFAIVPVMSISSTLTLALQDTNDLDCEDTAQSFEGDAGTSITVTCPAGCGSGATWGTDIYTADSRICIAAQHAGVVASSGGTFRIRIRPGQDSYEGSERHGISTSGWGRYERSFEVLPMTASTGGAGCDIDVSSAMTLLQSVQTAAGDDADEAQRLLAQADAALTELTDECAATTQSQASADTPETTEVGGVTSYVTEPPEGRLTFDYATDWFVRDVDARIAMVANNEDLLSQDPRSAEPTQMEVGDISLLVGLIDAGFYRPAEIPADAEPDEFLEVIANAVSGGSTGVKLVELTPLTISGHDAARLVLQGNPNHIIFILIEMGEGSDGKLYGQVLATVLTEDLEQGIQAAEDIAETLVFEPT
jgi:hypothetical protein